MTPKSMLLTPLHGIPLVAPGDDLCALILNALQTTGVTLASGDVLVVTSKIVSKAEGRYVELVSVTPGEAARQLAEETRKDPRVVELVLSESQRISRKALGVLVVQHRLGFVSANAGIDQSNVEDGDNRVLLLPLDPDSSARKLREALYEATGAVVGIVITDSHGRPFRLGNVGVAVGVAGLPALVDLRGREDLFGRELRISVQAFADQLASAANLLTGEANEGLPVVLVRGLEVPPGDGRASDLYRAPELDLYR